jgi:hypothetical protein
MKAAVLKQNGRREYSKHGLTVLKRAVNGLGNRAVDKRTRTGKALAKWRADLVQDLGGDVSTQQDALVDLCVKSKLLLNSIDVWLLTQPSLINKRKKTLLPVVKSQHGQIVVKSNLGLRRLRGRVESSHSA